MKFTLSFLVAILFSTMASALPITVVYTGTLSANSTLDGEDVAGLSFVFTATGDTANVIDDSVVFTLPHDTATLVIDSGPAITLITSTQTFSSTISNIVGLTSEEANDIFGDFSISGYDFTTDVAQITDPTAQFINTPQFLQTSAGELVLAEAGSGPGTFQATVGAVAIPLPPTLLLSLAGLGLLHVASRRAHRAG